MIRVGTRDSQLAKWQAEMVSRQLEFHQHSTELVFIKSEGDIDLITPLYEIGVQGIFTKALDIALLENKIDIAVHSYKDIPIQPAKGLRIAAILKRANPLDMLVCKSEEAKAYYSKPQNLGSANRPAIATSSIRRKAQWLHRYPGQSIESLRGNVNTRLQKLKSSNWDGAIFAAAGLERLGLTEAETGPQLLLPWMLPAPAQGAMAVVRREHDESLLEACAKLHDEDTAICTGIEREFLRLMMGGCSTPFAGLAEIEGDRIIFKASITSPDGRENIVVTLEEDKSEYSSLAQKAIHQLRQEDVHKILAQ
jgi:hydroxymethylbilane synthase